MPKNKFTKDKVRRTKKRKPKQIYILRRNVKEEIRVQYQKVIKAWEEKSSVRKVSVNWKDALHLTSWQEMVKNYMKVVKSLQWNKSMKHQSWILENPIDEDALEWYPADTPQYSIKVKADENCLPYTGSIHGFGNYSKGKEMRVRIIVEAFLKKMCISHTVFSKRAKKRKQKINVCILMSNWLSEEEVESIFNNKSRKVQRMVLTWEYGNYFLLQAFIVVNFFQSIVF